jgi:hypothetical protein
MYKKIALVLCVVAICVPGIANAQWLMDVQRQEMTGEKICIATSSLTSPTRTLDFPYNDLTAMLFIRVQESDGSYTTGVIFSGGLNLTGGEYATDGSYYSIVTRVRWDEEIVPTMFREPQGLNLIFAYDTQSFAEHIVNAKTALLELVWHAQGTVYFNFSLVGSSNAISSALAACGNPQ